MNDALVARAIARTDHLRRLDAPGPRKEWLHFCVSTADLDVLLNFSVTDAPLDARGRSADVARVVLLVIAGDRVVGEVDTFAEGDFTAPGGAMRFEAGDHAMRFEDGVFHLRARLEDPAMEARLTLRPRTMPALAQNLPLGGREALHWLIVPRLTATGTVTFDGRTHTITDAPAYHDHNWGRFAWGDDMAWEWGFALPDDPRNPWSVVFARLTDRARHRTRMQAITLWHGGTQHALLRDRAVETHWASYVAQGRVARVPRVMGLLMPERGTDVPAALTLTGEDHRTHLALRFDTRTVAQVVVPNDTDLGRTVIHECCGPVTVQGHVHGRALAWQGRGFFEFLGA